MNQIDKSVNKLSEKVDMLERDSDPTTQVHKFTPEENYQYYKEHWYFHSSSWYMRGADRYDGKGCNNGVCVPECKYYFAEGRIEE